MKVLVEVKLLVGLDVKVKVRVGVKVKVLVAATAEGVAVGGIGEPDKQTLSIQYPKVMGFPWVSHWKEVIWVMAWAMVMKVLVCPRGTGTGQDWGPQSPHSKALIVRMTCCQVLAVVTTKLKPYWLSVPPPLPAMVTPW